MTDVHTAVTEALGKLAAEGSAAQVAARLDMDCAAGERRSFTRCPVAEWLLAVTGCRVTVAPDWWAHTDETRADEGWPYELPSAVSEFVSGFDREYYPRLDVAAPQ